MKKMILTLALVASMVVVVNAQADTKNIGVRLTYGAEISYQQPLGSSNRLEIDAGLWAFNALSATAIYQWVWDLSEVATGLNWYAGFGAGLLTYENFFGVGPFGQVGIEYNFNIPLQLSLDYRPGWYIFPNSGYSYEGIALGVRYKF